VRFVTFLSDRCETVEIAVSRILNGARLMERPSVLIVGAGPTGLVLALWLTKLGVPVRIVDAAPQAGMTSRALAVHARTLELYQQLDLADVVSTRGYPVPQARLWLAGREVGRISFEKLASDLTPYPFLYIFPQDEHEKLLIERLGAMGVRPERSTELLSSQDEGDQIVARLRGPDGKETTAEAAYIAGCDGARSKVRRSMEAGFAGGTYPQLFYVADVEGCGPAFNGDLNVDLDAADFLAVFPLADTGRVRLIGALKEAEAGDLTKLTFDDIKGRAIAALHLKVDKVNWFSVYHAHHRVTAHFRRGRAFLLGDAAHIHSPVGGQGMNTGIGDAINLAWKLEAVLAARAPDSLLDTYETERRAFATRLVETTDRIFSFVAAEGHLADVIRTRLAPLILPQIVKLAPARDYIFRTISQITLNYRHKGLAEGQAGPVHGGDRMPWVKLGGIDNYQSLRRPRWQLHVYGDDQPALRAWSEKNGLLLQIYAWERDFEGAGLRRNALYLIRPDTYVAFAQEHQNLAAVERFLAKARIQPQSAVAG
jgi:2-polyprenyl-6-methoxyphenol hydroxylase-like FAD-dependent oxidoreductase